MSTIFVSYRGFDSSRVREIERYLKDAGLCHEFEDDVDDGDESEKGFQHVYTTILRPKLRVCGALLLLIGNDTHSPREFLDREIKYAISNKWNVFGLHLTNRTGGPPPELPNYPYYIDIPNNKEFSEVVSIITNDLPCE